MYNQNASQFIVRRRLGQLEGKCAVIVGASQTGNIGQVIAQLFCEEGAQVVVASRNGEASAVVAESIGGFSTACDLSNRAEVFALSELCIS